MASTAKKQEVLKKARNLVKNGWTKNVEARDANGSSVPSGSPKAVEFCVMGAVCCSTKSYVLQEELLKAIRVNLPKNFESISAFNDAKSTNLKKVLALFDKTIKSVGTEKVRSCSCLS
jgi:hypothetical protein